MYSGSVLPGLTIMSCTTCSAPKSTPLPSPLTISPITLLSFCSGELKTLKKSLQKGWDDVQNADECRMWCWDRRDGISHGHDKTCHDVFKKIWWLQQKAETVRIKTAFFSRTKNISLVIKLQTALRYQVTECGEYLHILAAFPDCSLYSTRSTAFQEFHISGPLSVFCTARREARAVAWALHSANILWYSKHFLQISPETVGTKTKLCFHAACRRAAGLVCAVSSKLCKQNQVSERRRKMLTFKVRLQSVCRSTGWLPGTVVFLHRTPGLLLGKTPFWL